MFLGKQLKISPTQYGTFSEQNMGFHQEKVPATLETCRGLHNRIWPAPGLFWVLDHPIAFGNMYSTLWL